MGNEWTLSIAESCKYLIARAKVRVLVPESETPATVSICRGSAFLESPMQD